MVQLACGTGQSHGSDDSWLEWYRRRDGGVFTAAAHSDQAKGRPSQFT